MQIIIRKSKLEDMPGIYDLVYELAVFENEPNAITTSIEAYENAFNEHLIDAFIAENEKNEMIGIALFYLTFSTWKGKCLYLEDFYVKPSYRKYGVGQQLFDAYLNEAKLIGAKQAKWQVLDWNEIGIRFYAKNNAFIEKNWWNGKIFFD